MNNGLPVVKNRYLVSGLSKSYSLLTRPLLRLVTLAMASHKEGRNIRDFEN